MLNKSDRGERIQQKVVFRGGMSDPSKLKKSSFQNSEGLTREASALKTTEGNAERNDQDIMPVMETIPLAWV